MEELIYNLADTHFFFNDLEVRALCKTVDFFEITYTMQVVNEVYEMNPS
jgi:hypothetical protein